jgi:hypothetical protein
MKVQPKFVGDEGEERRSRCALDCNRGGWTTAERSGGLQRAFWTADPKRDQTGGGIRTGAGLATKDRQWT